MPRVEAQRRTVLGGAMHGQRITILHGSTMVAMSSGDEYRRHGLHWWVPVEDTDEEATARVRERQRSV